MHYLVFRYRTGERLGKFRTEQQAQEFGKAARQNGYVIVEAFDNSSNSRLKNFVWSDNSCNHPASNTK